MNGTWKSTKWRFAEGSQDEGFDEVGVKQYGKPGQAGGVSFYKSANLKPSVVFRPYEPPAQTPSDEYPFYFVTGRLLEHWHTGTMTRRVPELDRALPEALLNLAVQDVYCPLSKEPDYKKTCVSITKL